MKDHGIPVLRSEFLPREHAGGGQNLLRWRRRRHRKDDIVDEPRRASLRAAVPRSAVLPGGEIEVPLVQERFLRILAGDALALLRLDLELLSSADVREMRSHRASLSPAAGDLYHDFRGPPHGAPDLLDLCGAEPPSGRSRPSEAADLQKWPPSRRQPERSSTHSATPSS